MKYICDTNFIIRYLIADDPEMFASANEIFTKARIGDVTLVIEQTVFTEVVFVLSSFYKVPRVKIAEVLSELLAYKGIECHNSMIQALEFYKNNNLHIVDCLLLSVSKNSKIKLLTFDKDLIKNSTPSEKT